MEYQLCHTVWSHMACVSSCGSDTVSGVTLFTLLSVFCFTILTLGCRQNWNCCGRPLVFVASWKHSYFSQHTDTGIQRGVIVLWHALGLPPAVAVAVRVRFMSWRVTRRFSHCCLWVDSPTTRCRTSSRSRRRRRSSDRNCPENCKTKTLQQPHLLAPHVSDLKWP